MLVHRRKMYKCFVENTVLLTEGRKTMTNEEKCISSKENFLEQRARVELALRTRALRDQAFRQALQENPKPVLEREYPDWFVGGKIPESLTIKVIQEDEQTLHLVLPTQEREALAPIEEDDLAVISGGMTVPKINRHLLKGPTCSPQTCLPGCVGL
jgi:hypothetical protein